MSMKPAFGINALRNDAGVLQAVVLGPGGAAEHECGIDEMHDAAGIPRYNDDTTIGLEARSASSSSPHVTFIDRQVVVRVDRERKGSKRPHAILAFGRYHADLAEARRGRRNPWFHEENAFSAEWNERAFLIEALGADNCDALRTLHEGIAQGDFAIWYGTLTRNPFERPGLMLARPSLVDEASKTIMRDHDLARIAFADHVRSVGILQRFEAALNEGKLTPKAPYGLGYMPASISPGLHPDGMTVRRGDGEFRIDSEYDITLFVSRSHDRLHGWYSVEEVDQWIEGHGPLAEPKPSPAPAR